MADKEMIEVKKWHSFPCASASERIKRLDMIEKDPRLEVRFVIPISPGHSEILYTELQTLNPPGTDAREVRREEMLKAAREAAKEARKTAEEARTKGETGATGSGNT